jgi:quercetin dioxygenase-like cupin family protein
MEKVVVKRFGAPDERREFDKGSFEVIHVGPMTIGRARYEPGWQWSQHVGPASGARSCGVEHVGFVISGRAAVRMDSGQEVTLEPGDLFFVPPGHDSWVVGDAPYVSLHLLGAEQYANKRNKGAAPPKAKTASRKAPRPARRKPARAKGRTQKTKSGRPRKKR